MRTSFCSIEGCAERVVGRKLCRAHYQRAWNAGEFVNVPLPPRVPGAVVCPPDHKHDGSTTCYIQHQCRCVPCRANNTARVARTNRLKAYGRYDSGLVDAAPVREHMMMLAEFGLGYKRVAAIAGIGITPVRCIIWGRQDSGPRNGELQKRVKRATAEAILSVKPELDNLADGACIPARGVHRRVQALVARGWSQAKIASQLGVHPGNWSVMMTRPQVTVGFHRAVAKLYDQLWNETPPHEEWHDKASYSRALSHAAARRWLPPLAWDDIDNDPEPPVPDEVIDVDEMAVELAISGDHVRLNAAERREAVRRLHASRWSDGRIASTLRVADRTVLRIRQELDLEAFDQNDLVDVDAA